MNNERVEKVILVSPRGFCAGVARAIRVVEDALEIFPAPVYVKHEIVHNRHVVERLEGKGAVTVNDVASIPNGAVAVFSAHGSKPDEYEKARARGIRVIDATCPLVTKVHLEVGRYLKEGYEVVYIGHAGHIEGAGVIAEGKEKRIPLVETIEDVEALDIGMPEKIAYLTQTTLSVSETAGVIEALRKKYPHITAPPIADICYATTNRQEAIRELSKRCDLVLVIGSKNSSNSTRLMEVAREEGVEAYRIDSISELDPAWLSGVRVIGMSAGASAPEELVEEAVSFFVSRGAPVEELSVKEEHLQFSEPVELTRYKQDRS